MAKAEELRALLQEAIDAAVPLADAVGRWAGVTQCGFCHSWGSLDHPLEHKPGCFVFRAKAALADQREASDV